MQEEHDLPVRLAVPKVEELQVSAEDLDPSEIFGEQEGGASLDVVCLPLGALHEKGLQESLLTRDGG